MTDYWSFTDYIHSEDLEAIEQALTQIFEREGTSRIKEPPQIAFDKYLPYSAWEVARELWIVGLFAGAPGWTIVQAWPSDLLCRRARAATRPRLSELAMQIGSDAFHFGVYNTFFNILMEADSVGRLWISGDVGCEPSEEGMFYDEVINARSRYPQFQLLDVPEPMKAAMRAQLSSEQKERMELWEERQEQIDALNEDVDVTSDWAETNEIEVDWEEWDKCDPERRDEALWELLKGSCYFSPKGLFEQTFAKQKKPEMDEVRLLYFQPAEFYRNLNRGELFSKY